jgi:glucosamine 6-phosphate synthetase-like amidotransferase/phosphosugar isomerase protein
VKKNKQGKKKKKGKEKEKRKKENTQKGQSNIALAHSGWTTWVAYIAAFIG